MHGVGPSTSAIAFRPLRTDDFPALLQWLSAPHVAPWFPDGPATLQGIEKKYCPRIARGAAVQVHIVTYDANNIGFAQCYLVDDVSEYLAVTGAAGAVGIDFVVGDITYVGRGLGAIIIQRYITEVVHKRYPSARHIVSSPHPDNTRSLRVLEKVGFMRRGVIELDGKPELLCTLSLCGEGYNG